MQLGPCDWLPVNKEEEDPFGKCRGTLNLCTRLRHAHFDAATATVGMALVFSSETHADYHHRLLWLRLKYNSVLYSGFYTKLYYE
jgi:hypothetical protein